MAKKGMQRPSEKHNKNNVQFKQKTTVTPHVPEVNKVGSEK